MSGPATGVDGYFESVQGAATWLRRREIGTPDAGIVLGSVSAISPRG